MLRKRFNTALLALLVAVAMPASVFAEEVTSDATIIAPTAQTEPAAISEEAQAPEAAAPAEEAAAPVEEVIAPAEEAAPVEEVVAPAEEVIAPAEEVIAPAEKVIAPVEEVVVPEAVVVPVAATLTIQYHGKYQDVEQTIDEVIEGYNVGDVVDLTEYINKMITDDFIVYTGEASTVTVDQAETTIVLEYTYDL